MGLLDRVFKKNKKRLDPIETYVTGTRFDNPDGSNRKKIIHEHVKEGDFVYIEPYIYKGETAYYVRHEGGIIGNVPSSASPILKENLKNARITKAYIYNRRFSKSDYFYKMDLRIEF